MRGVNKVILVGTLGKDPETKTFPNGGSLTQFSIATSESWVDKNTGERKEQTEWHRIVLSNKLGEIAQQYLRKGSKVYIEGSLRTRQWTDQNGQERYSTEVRGDKVEFLDSRQQSDQGFAGGNGFDVDASDLSEISQMLSKKLNREVELVFMKTDASGFNGIKVEISDLGIEIEINKNALKKSIIAHVLNTSKIF